MKKIGTPGDRAWSTEEKSPLRETEILTPRRRKIDFYYLLRIRISLYSRKMAFSEIMAIFGCFNHFHRCFLLFFKLQTIYQSDQ